MVEIRQTSIHQLKSYQNFADVCRSYADESSLPEIGWDGVHIDRYESIEATGLLSVFEAVDGDDLVGLLLMLVNELPHYGKRVAITESFYVLPCYRSTGAGRELLKAAEDEAKQLDAEAFLVSAPANGSLDRVIGRWGYRESNHVYIKAL